MDQVMLGSSGVPKGTDGRIYADYKSGRFQHRNQQYRLDYGERH
jgi:hypothetical protein